MKEGRNIELIEDHKNYRIYKIKNGLTRSGRQRYRLVTQLKLDEGDLIE